MFSVPLQLSRFHKIIAACIALLVVAGVTIGVLLNRPPEIELTDDQVPMEVLSYRTELDIDINIPIRRRLSTMRSLRRGERDAVLRIHAYSLGDDTLTGSVSMEFLIAAK
jgi:hypothetical protein